MTMLQARFGWTGCWDKATTQNSLQGKAGWLRKPMAKADSDTLKSADKLEFLKKDKTKQQLRFGRVGFDTEQTSDTQQSKLRLGFFIEEKIRLLGIKLGFLEWVTKG